MGVKGLVNVLARRRSGLWLLGGVAVVLGTVERLLAVPQKHRPEALRPVPGCPAAFMPSSTAARSDFFTIKRTQSDIGLTFWVLQGHGVYASFELFDTWAEAIQRVNQRLLVGEASLAALL
jgi:hypothetical protein